MDGSSDFPCMNNLSTSAMDNWVSLKLSCHYSPNTDMVPYDTKHNLMSQYGATFSGLLQFPDSTKENGSIELL